MTAALEERVGRLEQKVEHLATEEVEPLKAKVHELDTWAGPGQNESLSANLAELRKQFAIFGKVQQSHTRQLHALTRDVAGLKTDVAGLKTDVAGLKTDVAVLKTDMVEVKDRLSQILDRLPPRQEAPRG